MPTTTITASQVSQPVAVGAGSIVTVTPGSGATATVEYTGGSLADIANRVAVWSAWAKGAVSATAKDYCADSVFLRVTAQGGSVSLDVNSAPSSADLASFTADWGIGGVQLAYDSSGNVTGIKAGNDTLNIGRALVQSGIPFLVAPSGSIGNNGALTLGTALLATYSALYVYLPASAISAGSAAGWYYAVMSSATAGTVYNNVYSVGQPKIPASPTPFVTTGPGAFAGVTGYINGPRFSLPGGFLGANGQVSWDLVASQSNTAGSKEVHPNLGGSFVSGFAVNASASPSSGRWIAYNTGVQNKQAFHDSYVGQPGYSSGGISNAAIDTALTQDMAITLQHAVATDWVMLFTYSMTAMPNA